MPAGRIALVSALLLLWSFGTALAQVQNQIRIGIGAPLTGDAAAAGVEIKQAVELAVEQRNRDGGIGGARLVAAAFDDHADAETARAIAQRFCDDPNVLGVLGHVDGGVTVAASEIYHRCGLAMITPVSSTPDVTERGF